MLKHFFVHFFHITWRREEKEVIQSTFSGITQRKKKILNKDKKKSDSNHLFDSRKDKKKVVEITFFSLAQRQEKKVIEITFST